MDNKKQKILDVLARNYNINLFSENGRLHIAEQIVDSLDNKTMPEFGDDVITEKKAKSMTREQNKKSFKAVKGSKTKQMKKPNVKVNPVTKTNRRIRKVKNLTK